MVDTLCGLGKGFYILPPAGFTWKITTNAYPLRVQGKLIALLGLGHFDGKKHQLVTFDPEPYEI